LPELVQVANELRDRSDFAIITVDLDSIDALPAVHKLIRTNKIGFPVLFDGHSRAQGNVQAAEWGAIDGIPRDILIDPQGNIVADMLNGKRLRPGLEFFLNHPDVYPPVGVRDSHTLNSDGSITVRLELSNPRHTPLKVEIGYWYSRAVWADDDPQHLRDPIRGEQAGIDIKKFEVTFAEAGDADYEVNVPALKDAYQFNYNLKVLLPETEQLLDGKGLWVTTYGMLRLDK
jgi:hypothetical protein